MMRLDHNRAVSQIARQLAVPADAVRKVTIWRNHSSTHYPDLSHAEVNGSEVSALVDETWTRELFIPTVAGRGTAILDARGASSRPQPPMPPSATSKTGSTAPPPTPGPP